MFKKNKKVDMVLEDIKKVSAEKIAERSLDKNSNRPWKDEDYEDFEKPANAQFIKWKDDKKFIIYLISGIITILAGFAIFITWAFFFRQWTTNHDNVKLILIMVLWMGLIFAGSSMLIFSYHHRRKNKRKKW